MKKYWKTLAAAAVGAFALVSCEDVPAPYGIPGESETETDSTLTGGLPYTSSNLYTNWTTVPVTTDDPWSQGNTYTQATGYQKWDGAETKSNKEVEGYLISPAINTTTETGKVKISFDQTLRYTNQDTDYANHSKIYVSKDYDGSNFQTATWEEVTGYTPSPSTYTDWTLYNSGEIQLPDEYANQEAVYVAFWFYAPASGSTTWELQNFKMEGGEASASTTDDTTGSDSTQVAVETVGDGTLANPYTVSDVNKLFTAKQYNTANEYYVKGIVSSVESYNSKYGSLNYYITGDATSAEETFYIYSGLGLNKAKFTSTDDLKVGDEVVVCGKFTVYNDTFEFQYNSYIVSLNGQSSGTTDDTTDDTTGEDAGSSDGITVDGTTVTLYNAEVIAGSKTVTIDLNSQGWENGAEVSTVNFDGGVITFNVGSGSTTPKFYSGTKGVRMYANNTLTITGESKAIASAVLTCDSYSGTNYVGNDPMKMLVNGNTIKLTNAWSTNSGGTQLRIQTITITFAD